jgi:hypothetical protein
MANHDELIKLLATKEPAKRKRPRVASVRVKSVGDPEEKLRNTPSYYIEFFVINDIDDIDSKDVVINQIKSIRIDSVEGLGIILPNNTTINSGQQNGGQGFEYDSFQLDIPKRQFDIFSSFQIADIVIVFKSNAVQIYSDIPISK